ncbi:D-glucuronyl C5-epimerase family protein [Arthrobacter sp. A2-55]|uniref:D-glucuronyl C5-epimerase family protein n=1 Tax=Arthrobacter sp. A2-55 TaxID=2897337 RepID=UPI0021CD2D07|nr:D-glucuronyl C5-epimerase family protein [Arthrobacter sp. A2-55]MCU6480076.1 D-glucuronyl C5-epimerase family protein [Arthrobacter sp. A2-55]
MTAPAPAIRQGAQFRRLRRRRIIRRRRIALGVVAVVTIMAVCGGLFVFRDAIWGPKFNHTGYELSRDGKSPYIGPHVVPLEDISWGEIGPDDVLITKLHGDIVYHPVSSAWFMNQMISSYRVTREPKYLERTIATANYLVANSVKDEDGTTWFPYLFRHDVKDLRMGVPWYSGMAQGMMVSTFVNLFEVTHDTYWKDLATSTVKSFDSAKNQDNRWFTNIEQIDGRKFVYYEEYPALQDEHNAHVVNGHIYALYGLYDYYRMTGDKHARWLFDVGATSIRDSFGAYRNPGMPSWYAATYFGRKTWGAPGFYHIGVTAQLRTLGDITGDAQFMEQANLLEADHNKQSS